MISDTTRSRWKAMIDDLKEVSDKLSQWELEFVDSTDARLSKRLDITTFKWSKKLHEVWERHCG